jgi:hypothetical protein
MVASNEINATTETIVRTGTGGRTGSQVSRRIPPQAFAFKSRRPDCTSHVEARLARMTTVEANSCRDLTASGRNIIGAVLGMKTVLQPFRRSVPITARARRRDRGLIQDAGVPRDLAARAGAAAGGCRRSRFSGPPLWALHASGAAGAADTWSAVNSCASVPIAQLQLNVRSSTQVS